MRFALNLLILFSFMVLSGPALASDSLSYSGRLVNTNGSPVTGSVKLVFEFAYTNALGTILCTDDKTLTPVPLTNGVFHVKLTPACGTSLPEVLANTPAGQSLAIRVTDATNSKVYSFQALHSMPFSLVSHMAKQIDQMGASDKQVLAWNDTQKKWLPSNAGAGNGSVTEVNTGTGLSGGPITNTGTISIATKGVTTALIADGAVTGLQILDGTIENSDISNIAAISRSKLAIGTPNYVLVNDGTGAMSGVAQLPITQGGTGASTASGARTNLGLGTAATRDVYGSGDVITSDSLPTASCQSYEKLTWVVGLGWSCGPDNDSADATKLPLAGGTMTGDLSMGNMKITNLVMNALPAPTDVANVNYVDDAIVAAMAGFSGSQWTTTGSDIYYSTGKVGVGTNSPVGKLDVLSSSYPVISGERTTTVNSGDVGVLKLKTRTSVDMIDGLGARIDFALQDDTSGTTEIAHLGAYRDGADNSGSLRFKVRSLGTEFTALNISANRNVGIGTLTPSSKLHVTGDTLVEGMLRLKSTNTNFVELKAPTALAATLTFNWPGAYGTSGQMLTTDGAGNLSWTTVSTGSASLGGDLTGTTASAVIANDAVTSAKILDGTIVNADVSVTAAISRSKLANGTANYVVVNNGSGVMSEVAQLPIAQGGTGASTAAAARTNLGLGTAATRDVTGTGDVITVSALPTTGCTASEKLLWQIPGGWSCVADLDSADGTKLPLAGGTMSGPINMGGTNKITNLGTPTANADAATKLYVDNLVSGFTGSQWTTSGSNIYYNGGNVGIGTTAPTTKLHIEDASSSVLTLKTTSTTGTTQFQFLRGTKETSFGPAGTSFDLYSEENLPFEMRLDGSTLAMHVTPAGVMSIGQKLSFRSPATPTNGYIEISTSDTFAGYYKLTLPNGLGTNGQVLTTNASGVLSWTTPVTSSTSLSGDVTGTISSNTIANNAVTSAKIADGTIVNADIANGTITYAKLNIADGDIPAAKVNGLTTSLAGKEPTITAGTTAQYWRGDKTWQTLNTTAVPEGTNLYFTEPRVLGTDLFGLNVTALLGPVIATDDVLSAIGKLQGQVTANKTSFDNSGVWNLSGGNVYRDTGYVSIGTATPLAVLTVAGGTVNSWATGTIRLASDAAANYIQSGVDTSSGSARDLRFSPYNSSISYMTIAADGKVGIGTSLPSDKFHVHSGDIYIKSASAANSSVHNGVKFGTDNDPYFSAIKGNRDATSSRVGLSLFTADGATPAERMRISYSGNVGIGTSAPTTKLEVVGADSSTPFKSSNGGSQAMAIWHTSNATAPGARNSMVYWGGAFEVYDQTNNLSRLWISDTGLTGIGTTAPTRKLTVAADAGNSGGTFGGGVPLVRLQGTGSNFSEPSLEFAEQTNAPIAAIAAKNVSGGAGHLILQTRKTGDAALTEKMRINDDGNIGIGLTSPTSLLHVQRNADASATVMVQNPNSGAEAYAQVNLKTNSGLNSGMWKNSPNKNFYGGVNSLNVGTNGAENMSLVTNNISRLIVDSNGNVGVGGFPSYKFDVAGDVNGARILVAGNQVCTSGGCTTSSDKRLKKNINPLQESFEKILSLQGVEYDWKDTKKYGAQHQVGFIAQDLEKVYPEVVVTDPKTGLKSVAYGNLVAPLIEAFKELVSQTHENSKSTKAQTREIASLKTENENLKKENAEMKARLDRIEHLLKIK